MTLYVLFPFMDHTAHSLGRSQASDPVAAHADYYRRVLHELIEMGTDIARTVHRQAVAPGAEQAAPADVTVAFDRVCRGVRRSILLARTLDAPPSAGPGAADGLARVQARRRILRRVEDAIHREARGDEAERLHGDLLDRLDAPELDDDLATRPVEEIIDEICIDLGLGEHAKFGLWKRRTPGESAVLWARAAARPGEARAAGPAPVAANDAPPAERMSPEELALALAGQERQPREAPGRAGPRGSRRDGPGP